MGLFTPPPPKPVPPPPPAAIPVLPVDVNKRYDVYCSVSGEERVYDDVRFVCVRTFDRITEFSAGYIHGFFEVEAANGTRVLIPSLGIQMICEPGTEPAFRVIRRWRTIGDE